MTNTTLITLLLVAASGGFVAAAVHFLPRMEREKGEAIARAWLEAEEWYRARPPRPRD